MEGRPRTHLSQEVEPAAPIAMSASDINSAIFSAPITIFVLGKKDESNRTASILGEFIPNTIVIVKFSGRVHFFNSCKTFEVIPLLSTPPKLIKRFWKPRFFL